jgi:hypothetical protein
MKGSCSERKGDNIFTDELGRPDDNLSHDIVRLGVSRGKIASCFGW